MEIIVCRLKVRVENLAESVWVFSWNNRLLTEYVKGHDIVEIQTLLLEKRKNPSRSLES